MKKYILVFILSMIILSGCAKTVDDENYGEPMSKEDIKKAVEDINGTVEKINKNSTVINIDTEPLSDL